MHAAGAEDAEDVENMANFDQANDLITCLQLIECTAPFISAAIIDDVFELLPKLCLLLKHPLKAVSYCGSAVRLEEKRKKLNKKSK